MAMCYRDQKTKDILQAFDEDDTAATNNDIFSGSDFLDLHEKLNLTEDDTTVMFSLMVHSFIRIRSQTCGLAFGLS